MIVIFTDARKEVNYFYFDRLTNVETVADNNGIGAQFARTELDNDNLKHWNWQNHSDFVARMFWVWTSCFS